MDANDIKSLEEMGVRYKSFTPADKATLKRLASEEGMTFDERCPDCWRDIFLILRNKYVKTKTMAKQKKYIFKGKRPLKWQGKEISQDSTLKDIEAFIAVSPFHRVFFALAKKEEKGEGDEV